MGERSQIAGVSDSCCFLCMLVLANRKLSTFTFESGESFAIVLSLASEPPPLCPQHLLLLDSLGVSVEYFPLLFHYIFLFFFLDYFLSLYDKLIITNLESSNKNYIPFSATVSVTSERVVPMPLPLESQSGLLIAVALQKVSGGSVLSDPGAAAGSRTLRMPFSPSPLSTSCSFSLCWFPSPHAGFSVLSILIATE